MKGSKPPQRASPFRNITNVKNLDSYLSQSTAKSYNFEALDQTDQKMRPERDRSLSCGARLKELCPEDKAKIGELVKKLAQETKEKQSIQEQFQ